MGRNKKLKKFLSSRVMEDQHARGDKEEERNKGGIGCIKSWYRLRLYRSLAPSPREWYDGMRWKRDFEEGLIHPFLPQSRRRGIKAEALDTARDVKTHPYSSFPIMHLPPSKPVSEGDFTPYLISLRALLSEADHIPSLLFATLIVIFTSLWWQLRLQSFAA